MKNNDNANNTIIQDEREIQNNDKALAGAAVVSMLCNLALMIFGLFRDNLLIGGIAALQLCLMGITVAVIKGRKNSIDLPKTFGGKTISTEMTAKGRLNRIGYCCLDSVVFGIGYTLIDMLLNKGVKASELAVQFVILFVISFIIDFIHAEYVSKKYNRLMAQYESDDEDEDIE